jgi:hypothetical protein
VAEIADRTPGSTDLAGHLGELVRPQQEDGHHGDDEKLGGVEIEHLPSLYGP